MSRYFNFINIPLILFLNNFKSLLLKLFAQISEKHRRMQLLEYIYNGSTTWYKNRIKRNLIEDTSSSTNLSPPKTIGLMFRTIKPDGILIYAATNKHFTSVEVKCNQPTFCLINYYKY